MLSNTSYISSHHAEQQGANRVVVAGSSTPQRRPAAGVGVTHDGPQGRAGAVHGGGRGGGGSEGGAWAITGTAGGEGDGAGGGRRGSVRGSWRGEGGWVGGAVQ